MNTERQPISAGYPVTDGNGYFPLSATRARVRALYENNGYYRLPVAFCDLVPMPRFSEMGGTDGGSLLSTHTGGN